MEQDILEKYRKAGAILKEVRENAVPKVRKGARLLDVANAIEAEIVEKGGRPAFPVNISINSEAAHDTPGIGDERVFGDDMVKVDIGVHVDGYIADTAVTADLSGNPDLVKASRKALEEATKLVRPGVNTSELGKVIEETIDGFGLKPVYNLTGHGLERFVQHAEPPIPNKRIGQGVELKEGQVIAIEPFATNGIGIVVEGSLIEIFSLIKAKPVRMPYEREALKVIQEYNGLPFARRWLSGIKFIDKSLNSFMRQGIIHGYPVLVEHQRGLVSQAENTMIITADGYELTT